MSVVFVLMDGFSRKMVRMLPVVALALVCPNETATAAPVPRAIQALNTNTLVLGAGALHQAFHEQDRYDAVPTAYLDRESGTIPSASVEWRYTIRNTIYTALRFTYSDGSTDYDGYLQDLNADSASADKIIPYQGETDNRIYDLAYRAGYCFVLGQRVVIVPLLELGYGHWNRSLAGPYGYQENYDTLRLGAGLQLDVALTRQWVLEARGLYAGQAAHIDAASLDESLGIHAYDRLGVLLDYRVSPSIHIGLGAERVHYRFGQSDIGPAGFIEPASVTTQSRFLLQVGIAL